MSPNAVIVQPAAEFRLEKKIGYFQIENERLICLPYAGDG